MPVNAKAYRYQLPKKAVKANCPNCSPKHRKTLSQYVDTKTEEPLPDIYGRCDRESNCGYHLSPYHKGTSGMSYADEVREYKESLSIPKAWFRMAGKWKSNGANRQGIISGLQNDLVGATPQQAEYVARYILDKPQQVSLTQSIAAPVIYTLPDEVVSPSLGHYEQNQFAHLLCQQFGKRKASELLQRFKIGTSKFWPDACVFWLVDEQSRARAGQIVLFADNWHKAKYIDKEGNPKVCISSVSHSLIRRYEQHQKPAPDWLNEYHKNAPRWPILFGLHQLMTEPIDKPIAIVEAPKTAVIGSAFIPSFIWLAVGALSYLNTEKLAPLRGRMIRLFPDLSSEGKAFIRWSKVSDELKVKGYQISVSNFLESRAIDKQKQAGLDFADYLLQQPPTVSTIAEQLARPGSILKPDESQLERLAIKFTDDYPAEWDDN